MSKNDWSKIAKALFFFDTMFKGPRGVSVGLWDEPKGPTGLRGW